MSIHSIEPEETHIDQVAFESRDFHGLKFAVTGLLNSRRQFSVVFGADGVGILSMPNVNARNPAHPKPTPPTEIALAVAA